MLQKKKKSCLNICIYMQSHRSNAYLFQVINTLVLIWITDTLWNPVLFCILTLQNYKGLLLAHYRTGRNPKSYRHSWKWKVIIKISSKRTVFPLESEASGNMLQRMIWNLGRSKEKIWTCTFFSNHLMSADAALLLFSFIMQICISSWRNNYSGEKSASIFFAVLAIRPGFRCAQLKLSEVVNMYIRKKLQLTDSLEMFFPHTVILNWEALRLETILS